MSDATPSSRTSLKAIAALVLGFPPLNVITFGLPALLVGFFALREINQSEGRLIGKPMAVAGMVLGVAGTATVVVWLLAVVLLGLRATSYQVYCQNNLRVMGEAVHLYYHDHQLFPTGTIPNADLQPEQRLSWLVSILPYLAATEEQLSSGRNEAGKPGGKRSPSGTAYEAIHKDLAWNAPDNEQPVNTTIRWFLCPSDPGTPADHRPALTSYVGIAGIGANAAQLPTTDPNAGVLGYDRRTTFEDITAGISSTMLATETASDNGSWAAGGPPTLRGVIPSQEPLIGVGRLFGGCHPGGLNVLFVDNHVQFIQDTITPRTFEAMATMAGRGAPNGE
jgi:prepilin-type processing-associated H-X9-DG protein